MVANHSGHASSHTFGKVRIQFFGKIPSFKFFKTPSGHFLTDAPIHRNTHLSDPAELDGFCVPRSLSYSLFSVCYSWRTPSASCTTSYRPKKTASHTYCLFAARRSCAFVYFPELLSQIFSVLRSDVSWKRWYFVHIIYRHLAYTYDYNENVYFKNWFSFYFVAQIKSEHML